MALSSCEAEFYGASACAVELLGLAELFKELPDSARHVLQRRGPRGLKHIDFRCVAIQSWIREKRLSFGHVDTKHNTADIFATFLEGPRMLSLSKRLGLHITGDTDDKLLDYSASCRAVVQVFSRTNRVCREQLKAEQHVIDVQRDFECDGGESNYRVLSPLLGENIGTIKRIARHSMTTITMSTWNAS